VIGRYLEGSDEGTIVLGIGTTTPISRISRMEPEAQNNLNRGMRTCT